MSAIKPVSSAGAKKNVAPDGTRTNQKRRTLKALLDAALRLEDQGMVPNLQQVADEALVSRATAYRYFSSIDALLHQAHFEREVPPLSEVFVPGDDPVEAAGHAARVVNSLLLNDEARTHVVERASMQTWLDNPPEARPPRPGRRMLYIDPIVAATAHALDAAARSRLRAALSMVMGTEAVLALRDVADITPDEAISVGAWAAQVLVAAALAEGSA